MSFKPQFRYVIKTNLILQQSNNSFTFTFENPKVRIMKKLIFALFITAAPFAGKAQIGNFEEVVYLKNGSIYRGVIVEEIPGKSIKLLTRDQNIIAFQLDEVEKLTKERPTQNYFKQNQGDAAPLREKTKFNTKYKPGGVYLLVGFNGGAHQIGGGVGIEMDLGYKIFPKKKEWKKKVMWGGDIFGFATVQGFPFVGTNFQAGINGGASMALRFGKANYFYVTPYTGLNVITASHRDEYYDDYSGGYVRRQRRDFGAAIPIGLKLELTFRKFYFGNNTSLGGSITTSGGGGYFRTGLYLGVKF